MHRDQQDDDFSLTRALLEHAPTALLATTPEGRILWANQHARAMFGDELHDRWLDDLLAEPARAARAALWEAYQAVLTPRANIRLRGVLRDQAEVDLRLSLGHAHVDGALVLIASIRRDDEQAAELAALRARLDRLQRMVQHVPVSLYEAEATGSHAPLFISEGIREQSGFSPGDLIGDPMLWVDRLHSEDRAPMRDRRATLLETGHHQQEYRFLHRDGSYRWLRDSTRVLYDDGGNPQRLVGCWTDVTDLKQAEETREAAVRRSQALLDAIPDAMVRMNKDGEYLDFKAPRDVSLMPAPPVPGTRLQDRGRSSALVEHVLGTIRRVIETGQTAVMEYALEIDGESVYHETRVCKSGPDETVSIVRDVTERVRAEQRIKELNQSLEARNRELEASNRELESFSYSVSHDLRAPLRAIDGFSQVLLEDCGDRLNDEAKHMLGRIRAASQRMGQLMDDLLDLARIARSSLRRERVDSSAVATEVAESLRVAYPDHRVELTIAPGMISSGDRALLRVLMESLLDNAWKYTSRRDPARVELGVIQQDGTPVYFIRDNGVGFDMRYAHKLFGPFQRLHANSEFPGTGIGLATAARIVDLHDGRIWAEGAVDQGATFYFTLTPAGEP